MNFLYPQIALVIFLFYAGIEGFEEYGLYTLLRIFTFLICGFLAYQNHQSENPKWIWIFGIIAIIFNPIIKIKFDRDTWENVDLAVGSLLLFYTYLQYKNQNNTTKKTELPPEMRGVFDRMIERSKNSSSFKTRLLAHSTNYLENAKKREPQQKDFPYIFCRLIYKAHPEFHEFKSMQSDLLSKIPLLNKESIEKLQNAYNSDSSIFLSSLFSLAYIAYEKNIDLEDEINKLSSNLETQEAHPLIYSLLVLIGIAIDSPTYSFLGLDREELTRCTFETTLSYFEYFHSDSTKFLATEDLVTDICTENNIDLELTNMNLIGFTTLMNIWIEINLDSFVKNYSDFESHVKRSQPS